MADKKVLLTLNMECCRALTLTQDTLFEAAGNKH